MEYLCGRMQNILQSKRSADNMDVIVSQDDSGALKFEDDKYDICLFLGKTKKELRSMGDSVPLRIREILDGTLKLPSFTGGITSKRAKRYARRGELVFVKGHGAGDSSCILAQCLSNVDIDKSQTAYYATNRLEMRRFEIDSFTGLIADPVVHCHLHAVNNTIVRGFQMEILNASLVDGRLEFEEGHYRFSSKIKSHFCNIMVGMTDFRLHDIRVRGRVYPSFQVLINIFIVIHHWLRYDIRLPNNTYIQWYNRLESNSKQIALCKPDTSVRISHGLLMASDVTVNLFSLENIINDWLCLWISRLKFNPDSIHEFEREFNSLKDIKGNSGLEAVIRFSISCNHRIRRFVENNDHGIDYEKIHDMFKFHVDEAIDAVWRRIESFIPKKRGSERLESSDVWDYFNTLHFDRKDTALTLAQDVFSTGKTGVEFLSSLKANAHEISHMSMLERGDYVIFDDILVGQVEIITLVDPFIAEFREAEKVQPFRSRVYTAREDLQLTLPVAVEVSPLEYINTRLKTILVLDPSNQPSAIARMHESTEDMLVYDRPSRFFRVMALQATVKCLEANGIYSTKTTLDFSKIKLIGINSRKLGHTKPVDAMHPVDGTPSFIPKCLVCGESEVRQEWRYAMSCGHFWHSNCGGFFWQSSGEEGQTPKREGYCLICGMRTLVETIHDAE